MGRVGRWGALGLLLAFLALGLWYSLFRDPGATSESVVAAEAKALDRWTAWQQIQTVLRASPDHLPARARALVQQGDAAQIFAFVRDEIATYPPASESFHNALHAVRWGTRGTLRGGAGTPREKADLLVSLYGQAGFEAQVMAGVPDPSRLSVQKMLFHASEPPHAPPFSQEQAAAWARGLGHTTLRQYVPIDPGGKKAAALAENLLAHLPGGLVSPFDFTLPDRIPLVRVKVDGVWHYANPIAPEAAFGDAASLGEPTNTGAPGSTQRIRIALSAARSDHPYQRTLLLEQSFAFDQVVGRRIQLAFPPPVSVERLAGMRLQDVEVVVPMLSVSGPGLPAAERQELAVAGDMLSLGGDQYRLAADGSVEVNGETLMQGSTDPALLARVSQLAMQVNAATYPRIDVTLAALDQAGRGVPGIAAGAIKLQEDGVSVSFSIRRNQAPAPRLVLLYDVSDSLPPEFVGDNAVALGDRIVEALYAKHPGARVRVGTINFGASWMSGSWATDSAAARQQVRALKAASGNSDIWNALADVAEEQPTVVVMLSDGQATDQATPAFEQAVATGAPVFSIGIGDVDKAALDAISALSGGSSIAVTQLDQAIDAALAEIAARSIEGYRLSYRAPATAATRRKVTLAIQDQQDAASYEVPKQPVLPAALSGLYLTIAVGGREHTATLAGFGAGWSSAHPRITPAMLADVRSLLFGRISIQVEASAPSASTVLDEWIGQKLAFRPIFAAAAKENATALFEELEQGFSVAPGLLPVAQPPLRDAWTSDSLTFETGPRMAVMVEKLSPGGPVEHMLHLFPLAQWATVAEDPRLAWRKTLQRTAGLAIMESEALAGTSTRESLAGRQLSLFEPSDVDAQAGLSFEQQLAWHALAEDFGRDYLLLAPHDPGAFWAIHKPTGTVVGMLPNGTGGGAAEVCENFDQTNNMLQAAGLLGNFFGVAVGGWVELAKWEVKYLTMATLVIGYGGTAGSLENPALAMGCGILNDGLGNMGNLGQFHTGYDAAAGTWNTINPDRAQAPTLCGPVTSYNPCH